MLVVLYSSAYFRTGGITFRIEVVIYQFPYWTTDILIHWGAYRCLRIFQVCQSLKWANLKTSRYPTLIGTFYGKDGVMLTDGMARRHRTALGLQWLLTSTTKALQDPMLWWLYFFHSTISVFFALAFLAILYNSHDAGSEIILIHRSATNENSAHQSDQNELW